MAIQGENHDAKASKKGYSMDILHSVNLEQIPWQPHPTIPGVLTKIFENRASPPYADVMLAQVAVGGAIPWHVHENASETAYVLQGEGTLIYARDKSQIET